MAFLSSNAQDDYKNDIKPDQSMPNYNDSISSISWSSMQLPNYIATTSWDGELRILAVEQGQFGTAIFQKISYKFNQPALKATWNDQNTQIYVGLLDGSIKLFDVASQQVADIGKHNAGISSLHFVPGMNAVVSTAYENTVQIWQPGSPSPVMSIQADNKVFASDFQFPTLIAGTANEKILLVDINNTNTRSIVDSVDLGKFSQIQSVAINQKCTSLGVASFDGRANLSSINKNVNGLFAPVRLLLYRKTSLPLRATNMKRLGIQSCTPSTVSLSTQSTTGGS
jgi:mRNA export factor